MLPAGAKGYAYPRFSPNDRRIAVQVNDDDEPNVWIYDIEENLPGQLTFDGGERPLWSADGTEVTFLEGNALWTIPSDLSGTPELLQGTEVAGNLGPGSWSADGDVLLFASIEGIHAWERGAEYDASAKAKVIVRSPDGADALFFPDFSPDGQWFVYGYSELGELGTMELYVSPYPVGDGGRQRVDTDTGFAPVWVRNGGELIFGVSGGSFYAMEITTAPALKRSNPLPLFALGGFGRAAARRFWPWPRP